MRFEVFDNQFFPLGRPMRRPNASIATNSDLQPPVAPRTSKFVLPYHARRLPVIEHRCIQVPPPLQNASTLFKIFLQLRLRSTQAFVCASFGTS